MRHTCPDGAQTRLVRDPDAPIGELARHTCPRCGWAMDGADILDAARTILYGETTGRELALSGPTGRVPGIADVWPSR